MDSPNETNTRSLHHLAILKCHIMDVDKPDITKQCWTLDMDNVAKTLVG